MIGVGKLTTAKLLAEKINARLVDNHLLIDLVAAICERGGSEYLAMIEKIMQLVLEQIAEMPDEIFIFTNALSAEGAEDRKRLDLIKRFAENRKISFVQILLQCDLEENKRRIVSENRKLKGKLMNVAELEEICKNCSIYHPPAEYSLTIDSTHLSAEETSEEIKNYIEKITENNRASSIL